MRSQEDIEKELIELRGLNRNAYNEITQLKDYITKQDELIDHLTTINYALVQTVKLLKENKK